MAFGWKGNRALALIVANLASHSAQAHLDVIDDLRGWGDAFDFEDRLTGASYRWTRESLEHRGLYVRLEPGAAHLFRVFSR